MRGINSSVVIDRLAGLFDSFPELKKKSRSNLLETVYQRVTKTGTFDVKIPLRTPTFCPGCPHRDSSVVTKSIKEDLQNPEYMKKHHGREPIEVIFHGESGCHSMLQFEPFIGLMQNYSGMGLGGGTGAGIDPFALGTLTGKLMLVLRTGITDREMAGAKLSVLNKLPIKVVGAVLNDVRADGALGYYYGSYSYHLPGYEASDEDDFEFEEDEVVKVVKGGGAGVGQATDSSEE